MIHHDGNIDDSLSPKQLRDRNNSEKFYTMCWNSEKLKQKGIYALYKAFSIGISTAEMKKYLRLNYNLICSNTLPIIYI